MKLFVIECWNKKGGCIGNYYVTAANITAAKSVLKQSLYFSVGKMKHIGTEKLYI